MKPLILIALVALAACDAPSGQVELVGTTMGTQFTVKLPGGIGDRDALALQKKIEGSLDAVESMMSTYLFESEISHFNASRDTGWHAVSAEFCASVEQALTLSRQTDGAFDITVGPLVNLWGFGPSGFIDEPPDTERIREVLGNVGYEHLEADCDQPAIRKDIPKLVLDMSAFGKGYAVDRVAELLDTLEFTDYLVEVGGELRLRGRNAQDRLWAVGIEMPHPGRRTPHTVLRISDRTVATSGDYRNFFEYEGKLYSHTIDTRTGTPVAHSLASVTVVDDVGARADALATALLVLGPVEGMALARRDDLAVLFLLREEDEIKEKATPAFEKLRTT